MNNKRLTEIIEYYEKLSLDTKAFKQEEKQRIEQSYQGKGKKDQEYSSYDNSFDPYDNSYDNSSDTMNNISSSGSYNPYDELINLDVTPRRRIVMPQIRTSVVYYCSKCKLIFKDEPQFQDHVMNHSIGNSACYCRTCNSVFENDIEYYEHVNICKGELSNSTKDEDNIPEDPNGQYECPTCHKKYNNAFFVGEHFMKVHNDYSVFCELDHVDHNGFPGFEILKKIDMIDDTNNKDNEICEVCCFKFEDNIFIDDNEIKEDDRSPLIMKCCGLTICRDCIMHHIIESDSIICPFCRKDHTRTDWDYIVFVEPKDTTDREKWLPWWEDHIDIYSYPINKN